MTDYKQNETTIKHLFPVTSEFTHRWLVDSTHYR